MTPAEAAEIRRQMILTSQPERDLAKAMLEGHQTWTTGELTEEFTVYTFAAPFVAAARKSDGQTGTLEFTHSPRVYFNWQPHEVAEEPPDVL